MNEVKQTPKAIDLEEIVLGAMILERTSIIEVIDLLDAEAFYLEKNRIIFKAIKSLYESGGQLTL